MKASFPPFVSCFPPWSDFVSPRRLKSACHRGDGWAQKSSATACNRLDGTADKRLLLGEKAFIAMRFQCAWLSLRTIAISHARFPHSAITRRAADRAAGREGWRSQTEGKKRRDDWAELAPDQAAQGFPCHGGRVARATSSLIQSAFPSTTQVLCYFLHRRK